MYKQLFKQIDKNQKIAIYGTNKIAENIYKELKKQRPDVKVCFFINSEKDGILQDLPIYKVCDLSNYINQIDNVIISSYSARFLLRLALRANGIQNPIMIGKDFIVAKNIQNSKKFKSCIKVFKTNYDKKLFKLIALGRNDREKFILKIQENYIKKFKNLIDNYPIEHYFEFINKNAIKTVLDCGAYDGLHSVMFSQEFQNCEAVYMFEPSYHSFKKSLIDNIISKNEKIHLVEKAVWKESTILEFREEASCQTGSAIVEVKPDISRKSTVIKIDAVKIDDFVKENNIKVDFIKMDIENAELQALEGAIETLKTQRPQLAISIYHSDEQFYGIPVFLNEKLDNYEFRLGHYSNRFTETVLYAIPKELYK